MRRVRSPKLLAVFLVAGLFAVIGLLSGVLAQGAKPPVGRARPIPVVDFRIPWNGTVILGMHADTNRPVLGRPDPSVLPSDLRYYSVPLFAFVRKGTGELDVTVTDRGEITLPMVYDSEAARLAVRDYLVNQKLIPLGSMAGQVQTVAARVWYLETAPGYEPHVRFGPYENFQFPAKGQLSTRLSAESAQKFVADLRAGTVELHPTVVFDGYSYQDNSLVISADDIINSQQYKKLVGAGGEGKVGRHQIARILREACVIRNIAVTTEYHDRDFDELVMTIVKEYAAKESRPTADWDKVEAFFKAEGWDPTDFKADLIEASKFNENRVARDQFSTDVNKSFGGSASAGIKLFSGSASFNHSSNEKAAREVFSKWGIQTEFKGAKFIPKSIDIFALNAAKIRTQGTFAVGKRMKTTSDGILRVAVTSRDNVLHDKATPAYEERLEQLQAKLGVLPKLQADLGALSNAIAVDPATGTLTVKQLDAKVIRIMDNRIAGRPRIFLRDESNNNEATIGLYGDGGKTRLMIMFRDGTSRNDMK